MAAEKSEERIKNFLSLYSSGNTRAVYRSGIYAFLDAVYEHTRGHRIPSPADIAWYESAASRYFSRERDYHNDLMRFAASLSSRPPWTARSYVNSVKEFMTEQDIEFSQRDLKRVRSKLPKGGARTIEKTLDHEVLRTVLHHMDVHGKAVILVLASSGMRIDECLSLKMNDLDLETVPAEITVRGETAKGGEQRFSFISKEAAEIVCEWYKKRDEYIFSAKNRNAGLVRRGIGSPRVSDDDRVFPFTDDVVYDQWKNALKSAGLFSVDATTKRNQRTIHALRKFFYSQLSRGCPEVVVQMLMGHEGYLTDAYRRYTKVQAAEMYLKAEYCVTINIPKEIREIESEFKSKMAAHSEILENLVQKNFNQEQRNLAQERELKELRNLAETLQTMIHKERE